MKKEKDNLDLILSGEYNPEDYKNSKRYDDVRKEMEEEEKRKLEDDDDYLDLILSGEYNPEDYKNSKRYDDVRKEMEEEDYLEELNYQRGFMYKKGGSTTYQGGGDIKTLSSGLLTEEFVTKIEAAEISIWNAYDDPLTIAFGVGTVNWQFYTEIRSWGIKEVGVYVVSVKLTIYVEEDDKETKIIEIDSNADTEWEIETDTAHIDFSNNVYPQLIDVDMKTKIISINFN